MKNLNPNRIKSNVTVFLEVFNEEERIESCLKSFSWADELVVFDKQSTDCTREIAKKYASKLVSVPYSQASENTVKNISGVDSCEWCFIITASNLIHPEIVKEIIKLTNTPSFSYDVIAIPYAMYVFGIRSERSPWSNSRKCTLIRKSALKLSSELHNEIGYSSNRIFEMPNIGEEKVLYHCTHKNASDFFNRHMRYVDYEAKYMLSEKNSRRIKKSLIDIFRALGGVILKRRSFMLGVDGIALAMAYVSYFIMKFVYVWDSYRDNGDIVYPAIRTKIDQLWKDNEN